MVRSCQEISHCLRIITNDVADGRLSYLGPTDAQTICLHFVFSSAVVDVEPTRALDYGASSTFVVSSMLLYVTQISTEVIAA